MRSTIALYLPDGSTEYVIGEPEDVLRRIIREKLGQDCEELFDEIVNGLREDAEDRRWNYETYKNTLDSVKDDIISILSEPGSERDRIMDVYNTLRTI